MDMIDAPFVVADLDGIEPGEINLGPGAFGQVFGQPVMFDMAMGDEDVPQPLQIDGAAAADRGPRGSPDRVEKHQFPLQLRRVEMDVADDEGGREGVLLYNWFGT